MVGMIKHFFQKFNLFGASPWENGIIHDQGVYPFFGSCRCNYIRADSWSKQWCEAHPVCMNAVHKTVIRVLRKRNGIISQKHVHVHGMVAEHKGKRMLHDVNGWFALFLLDIGSFQQPWNLEPVKKVFDSKWTFLLQPQVFYLFLI